ncbi:MAG: hypothetical protein CMK59_06970 [Proteobacteria bacterium]|nr:hypothetical protein [Pseudomonadota bacterium]
MLTLFLATLLGCKSTEEDLSKNVISFEFNESCNPLALSNDCFLPYPSLHYTKEDPSRTTGLHLDYETEDLETEDSQMNFTLSMFNIADGVSPLVPALINFGVDVDPSFLSGSGEQEETVISGAPIALVHINSGTQIPILTEMDQANRSWEDYDQRHPLIIRPLAPMEFGERYMVVLTNELRDVDGNELPRSDVFDLLQEGTLTDNTTIEQMRPRYEDLFSAAEESGWAREDLLMMWDFQVASEDFVLGPARQVRDHVLSLDPNTFEFEINDLLEDPNAHLSWLVRGQFFPPNFLDEDNELVLDESHLPVAQDNRPGYPFTMVVPKAAKDHGDLSLVLIGHGLFGTGASMLDSDDEDHLLHTMANDLNAVLIATDWVGLSGGDRDLIISEVLPNLDRVRVVTDRLLQSHANALSLVELTLSELTSSDVIPVEHSEELLKGDKVYYYGISLGGIQGAGQTALSRRISRSVLAVPGAGWAHLIQRSTQFQPLEVLFDNLYPDPTTQMILLGMVQSFFDWSDPGNLSQLLNADDDTGPEKTIVLQEAIGDCQVANITTNLLARSFNAYHLENATDPVFGLETVSAPYNGGVALTQVRVQDALDEFFPPDANVTPETDNGVHNTAVLRDSIFEQIEHLYIHGELIHPCDGLCDPD